MKIKHLLNININTGTLTEWHIFKFFSLIQKFSL